jgi:mannitol/fructose-specific phosphotransferase system IIA component (Ntr-type)/CBS domain-containing protein
MKLSSVINKKLIFTDLKATTIEGIVDEMIGDFIDAMGLSRGLKEEFVSAVMERENQAATAFGKGVAFPHARLDKLNDFAIVIGKHKAGIDHQALDEKKVHLFFMILTAKTKNTQLLRALASLAELTSIEGMLEKIIRTEDPAGICKIIDDAGIDFKKTITAEDIMIPEPFAVTPEATIKEAADILFNKNIAGLAVVQQGKILGEITEKELIKVGLPDSLSMLNSVAFFKDFEPFEKYFIEEDKLKVKDIFSKNIQVVAPDTSILEVAFLFVSKGLRRLYVIDKDKNLVGIVMRHHVLMKILHP